MSTIFETALSSCDVNVGPVILNSDTNKIAYVDIISKSLFITSAVEQNLRIFAKTFSQLLDDPSAEVRLLQFSEPRKSKRSTDLSPIHSLKNVRWWKLLPNLNAERDSDRTPFVTAWYPILRIKQAYENFQCKRADITRLNTGFIGLPDDKSAPNSDRSHATDIGINLRMGVPTVDYSIDNCLIATPPSLAFALDLVMEICRSYVDNNAHDKSSNLSKETIGVLENWIDFITRGTLLFDDSDKLAISQSVWMRSNPDGNHVNCFPSPVTIFVESEDPVSLPSDDMLSAASVAWRNVVKNRISDGSAILVQEKEITKEFVGRVRTLCRNRLQD